MMNDYVLYYGKGVEHFKRDRFVDFNIGINKYINEHILTVYV